MNILRPNTGWSAGADYTSIEMQDGSLPPTYDELLSAQATIDKNMQVVAAIQQKLGNIIIGFNKGQNVAYATAIAAVGDSLAIGDISAAKEIIETFPTIETELQKK